MIEIQSTSAADLLKHWRLVRSFSQMELALECDTSSRHLSCVETGRAQPSRQLLLKFCTVLRIPLRVRNNILISAGYAPIYQDTGLSEPEMSQARSILERLVLSHDPNPAMLIDRCWNIILSNNSFKKMCKAFVKEPSFLETEQLNLMSLLFHKDGMAACIENLPYVFDVMLERARRTLVAGDPGNELANLIEQLLQYRPIESDFMTSSAVKPSAIDKKRSKTTDVQQDSHSLPQLVMPIHIHNEHWNLSLFTTVATLGSPLNIALQELQIECAYPIDDATEIELQKLIKEID